MSRLQSYMIRKRCIVFLSYSMRDVHRVRTPYMLRLRNDEVNSIRHVLSYHGTVEVRIVNTCIRAHRHDTSSSVRLHTHLSLARKFTDRITVPRLTLRGIGQGTPHSVISLVISEWSRCEVCVGYSS